LLDTLANLTVHIRNMLSSQSLQPAAAQTRTSVEGGRPIIEAHTVIAVSGRILFQVGLVPLLGRIKWIHSVNRCVNLLLGILDLTRIDKILQLCLDFGGNFLLLGIIAKDNGRVLCASIVSLTVLGRRVVELKEEFDEFLIMFLGFIEFNVKDFDVFGTSRAHLSVLGKSTEIQVSNHWK
jgi:hypothetical protein